ncbi:4-amino-4-deoxy-L-arabinose transferase-like glycosyltransferase [Rhodovulum iodosum]|uniref:4-amino-4-deoxy-L-arabinose transferase-like glycosyltransferase n=1 Tax=Rhodovulum iodosum TaxID=68291 RepID=A0ABV3XSL1_9RHOB|nr:glycosyltransferase family 39 protein [Rhodovulum robiginosum]RSK30402.1 glycosyl transferase [Rhodovulum robiginosum]
MPSAAAAERPWWWAAGALVLAITAARVATLALSPMDLFVDEAQYWLWGQELAFGYYSKPPMIGWVIRAATALGGSDAPFWVRLPGPLFHGVTAMVLGAIAARLGGGRWGLWVAAGYATLPMVALASILISTDTIMFPFLALALMGYLRLTEGAGRGWAMATGLFLGLAFLSKYAAIYYLLCAALAALLVPCARIGWRRAGQVALVFGLVISPNLIWNAVNGFSTLQHTADNADWVRDPAARAGLDYAGMAEFFAAQFAVFGPVLFAGLLAMLAQVRAVSPVQRVLLVFSLPIVALICGQALLSGAYANWAAAAYLAGSVAVLPWLTPRWRRASFAINGAVALALPLAAIFADRAGPATARYMGRSALSTDIMTAARAEGSGTVIAESRQILADLFYTGRDSGVSIFSVPPEGRPESHYALKYPFPGGEAPVILALTGAAPPDCTPDAAPVARIAPASGAYRGKTVSLYLVPGDCWTDRDP